MAESDFKSITILAGAGKDGKPEGFTEITLKPGDVLSIVGPTGCGKTTFISDLELFAQGDTISGRKVLINGRTPDVDFIEDPSKNPIALITQHTKCLADLPVRDFLEIHAKARKINNAKIAEETIKLANRFTGEPISPLSKTTTLSGGQTRALFIADAITIGNAPVILLDEIENAGIFKEEAIAEIRRHNKIVVFVTHDPSVSLLSDKRLVMNNGAVKRIIELSCSEAKARERVAFYDRRITGIREHIRNGSIISDELLASVDLDGCESCRIIKPKEPEQQVH